MSTIELQKKRAGQAPYFHDVWHSFRSLPIWVQWWLGIFLAPAQFASLFFLDEPMGSYIAFLAFAGFVPNIPILIKERGFTKLMAVPHIVPWAALACLIMFARPEATGAYSVFLWWIMIANTFSVLFDMVDTVEWIKGNREVAGFES